MPYQSNISVSEDLGKEKTRVFKKGFYLLFLLPAVCFVMCGTFYLIQSLLDHWFCYHCEPFNEKRFSMFWFLVTHVMTLGGYLVYKWGKKNEENKRQKEALEKAGKVAVLERILEDGSISPREIEEIIELSKSTAGKPQAKKPENSESIEVSNAAPVDVSGLWEAVGGLQSAVETLRRKKRVEDRENNSN